MNSSFLLRTYVAQLMNFPSNANRTSAAMYARIRTYVRVRPLTWLITFEHIGLRTYPRPNRRWDPQVIRTYVRTYSRLNKRFDVRTYVRTWLQPPDRCVRSSSIR